MKKTGRHSKSLIAVFLALIMLVGAAMPAVSPTVEGIKAMSASAAADTEESVVGSTDLEWLEVVYTNDEIVVTVAPEIDALLGLDKEQLKSVLGTFKGAVETLVMEKIKDSWRENNTDTPDGDPSSVEGITLDTVWKKALESYIDDNYTEGTRADKYIAFFDDMMNDNAKVEALVEHVCGLIALAVSAGVIKAEELPVADAELAERLSDTLDTFIHDYIETYTEEAIDRYIAEVISGEVHGTSELDVFAKHFIEEHFSDVIHAYLDHKSDPSGAHDGDVIDKYIDEYIDDAIKTSIDRYIALKVDGTDPGALEGFEAKAYEVMASYVADYVVTVKNDYVAYKLDGEWTHDDKILEIIEDFLDEFVSERVDKYIAYKSDADVALDDFDEYSAVYGTIELLIFSECKARLEEITDISDEAELLEIYKGYRGQEFSEATQGVDIAYFKNPDNLDLDSEDYENFKSAVSESSVLKKLNEPENREVFDSYVDAEISELEKDIAEKFFNEYTGSSELDSYIDDIIAYVMPIIREEDKAAVVSSVTESETLLGEALVELFDMGHGEGEGNPPEKAVAELKAREEYMTNVLLYNGAVNYKNTREELMKKPPELSVKDLLKELDAISITGDLDKDGIPVGGVIFSAGSVNRDNLVALIKDVPTISDVSDMTPEDMSVTLTILIETTVGDAEFDVTLRLDPDEKYDNIYAKINALAVLLEDNVSLSYSNRTLTLDVILPQISTRALTRILNSSRLSDSLKEKVYALAIGDLDGAKQFFDELTFEDARALLEIIDFEAIIREVEELADSNPRLRALLDRVKAKFDYTAITNEKILAKFDSYKSKFEKIKAKASGYVDKIYSRLPAKIKDKTIADFYTGSEDGYAVFELNFSYSATFTEISRKIIEACPEEYEGEMVYILDLLKQAVGNDLSATLDLSLSVPDVAKITYMVGDIEHRVGFLPKGVNPQKFSGVTEYFGTDIVAWVDSEGNKIESMPDTDTVLYAVLLQDVTVGVSPAEPSFVYNGEPHYLEVVVVYGSNWQDTENTEVEVLWYEGEIAEGTPVSSDKRLGVTDIGNYTYSLKVVVRNDYGEKTVILDNSNGAARAITFAVSAPEVSAEAVITDSTGAEHITVDKVYSDADYYTLTARLNSSLAEDISYKWYFTPSNADASVLVSENDSYVVRNVSDSGRYYAEISYSVNGVEQSSIVSSSVDVKISPLTIALNAIWNYELFAGESVNVLVYTGNEYSVIKDTVLDKSFEELFETPEHCKESAVGSYVAMVTLKDTNYVIAGGVTSAALNWHIIDDLTVLVTLNGASPADPRNISITDTYLLGVSHTVEITLGAAFTDTTAIWYKQSGDDWVAVDSLEDKLKCEFSNAESAVYKWVVTTAESGKVQTEWGTVNVNIAPASISLDGFEWFGDGEFTFDGTSHTPPEIVGSFPQDLAASITYEITLEGSAVTEIRNPGTYKVLATLAISEPNPNYILGTSVSETEVLVSKAVFDDTLIHWDYTEPFVYDGEEHGVALVGFERYYGVAVKYSDASVRAATEIGKYTAEFLKFVVMDGESECAFEDYYTLGEGSSYSFATSLEWEIVSVPTPVEKDEYVYDMDGVYVKVSDPDKKLLGYNLKVTPVYDYDIITLTDGRKMRVLSAYDVIFENEMGERPVYDGTNAFSVAYKTPTDSDLEALEIVYIDPSVAEHVLVDSALSSDNSQIIFEASHFSIYAIAVEYEEPVTPPVTPEEPEPPTEPDKEPEGFDTKILWLVALALLILLFIILISKKTKRAKKYKMPEAVETIELYEDLNEITWATTPTVRINGKAPDYVEIEESFTPPAPAKSLSSISVAESAEKTKKHLKENSTPKPGAWISVVESFEKDGGSEPERVVSAVRNVGDYSVTVIDERDLDSIPVEARGEINVAEHHHEHEQKPVYVEKKPRTQVVVNETEAPLPERIEEIPEAAETSVTEEIPEVAELPEAIVPEPIESEQREEPSEIVATSEDVPVEITADSLERDETAVEEQFVDAPILSVPESVSAETIADESAMAEEIDLPELSEAEENIASLPIAPILPIAEESAEEAPVEEAPVEEAPVEEAPVEEAPAEESLEEIPIVIASIEDAPADEASAPEETADNVSREDSSTTPAVSAVTKPEKNERRIIKASELDVPITVFMLGEDDSEDEQDASSFEPETPDVAPDISDESADESPVAPILPPKEEEERDFTEKEEAPAKGRLGLSEFSERKPAAPESGKISMRPAIHKKGRLSVADMKKSIPHHILNPMDKK